MENSFKSKIGGKTIQIPLNPKGNTVYKYFITQNNGLYPEIIDMAWVDTSSSSGEWEGVLVEKQENTYLYFCFYQTLSEGMCNVDINERASAIIDMGNYDSNALMDIIKYVNEHTNIMI
jgi:hypothetical protein